MLRLAERGQLRGETRPRHVNASRLPWNRKNHANNAAPLLSEDGEYRVEVAKPSVLIVAPTRELCQQIAGEAGMMKTCSTLALDRGVDHFNIAYRVACSSAARTDIASVKYRYLGTRARKWDAMAQGPSVELPPQVVQEAGTKTKDHTEQYLPWWFRAGCFCYSIVGCLMIYRLAAVSCDCALYPWKVESLLLVLQGFLSYMHDAHFQGSSVFFKYADRTCATFLAC
eukprot:3866658-Amphidinium_carterae.1